MDFSSFFDAIYCINLPFRQDRWKNQLTAYQKHNLPVKRFSGIFIKNGDTKVNRRKNGCLLSHTAIAKEALQKGYSRICILEDDLTFASDFSLLANNFSSLPSDYVLIYLSFSYIRDQTRLEHVTKDIYRSYRANDTSGYILNQKGCEILAALTKAPPAIDLQLGKLSEQYPMYAIMPPRHLERIRTATKTRTYCGYLLQNYNFFGSDIHQKMGLLRKQSLKKKH